MSLLNKVEKIDDWGIQQFWDKGNDGGCPCFSGKKTEAGKVVHVWGRCWRVSDNINMGYQDLHIWGDHPDLKKIAKETKRALDSQEWYNPYTIIYGDPNPSNKVEGE